jgi:hypothetical protein
MLCLFIVLACFCIRSDHNNIIIMHHHRIITGAAGVSFSSRGGSFVHEFVRFLLAPRCGIMLYIVRCSFSPFNHSLPAPSFIAHLGNTLLVSKMSFATSQTVCPLTKEALPESSLETAVIFGAAVPSSKMKVCGHACTMGALMDHLKDSKGGVKCPECETSHIISICDVDAAEQLCSSDADGESSGDLVSFRYGHQVFWLSIPQYTLAQERIAQVLGTEVTRLTVIHHGKIVYPQDSKNPRDLSDNLIDICKSDEGRKPSLVIIGKRTGRWGAQGGHVHR